MTDNKDKKPNGNPKPTPVSAPGIPPPTKTKPHKPWFPTNGLKKKKG